MCVCVCVCFCVCVCVCVCVCKTYKQTKTYSTHQWAVMLNTSSAVKIIVKIRSPCHVFFPKSDRVFCMWFLVSLLRMLESV